MVFRPNVQAELRDSWISKDKPSDALPNEFRVYSVNIERKEKKFLFNTNTKTMYLKTSDLSNDLDGIYLKYVYHCIV